MSPTNASRRPSLAECSLRALSRRQRGQPSSGASGGISAPQFGQILRALDIIGESLGRSLSLLRKILSDVTPGLQQLNDQAHLPYPGHDIAEISFAIINDRQGGSPNRTTLAIG